MLPPFEDLDDATLARFGHVESLVGSAGDLAPVEEFFHRALRSKCEGIMVKILDHEVLAKSLETQDIVKEEDEVDADLPVADALVDLGVKVEESGAEDPLSKSPGKSAKSGVRKKGKMLLPASYEPDK